MSTKLQSLLNEYGESHQNSTNKFIHWLCVPVIFWSIFALIYSIPNNLLIDLFGDHFYSNWAIVAIIPVIIYYLTLSGPITFGMILVSALCLFMSEVLIQNTILPLWSIAIAVFVIAWIGQFYGHHIEGKKPSFLKDIQFLLIGPAWLMHFIFKKLGINY